MLVPTDRPDLLLRRFAATDASALFNLVQANRSHLTRHGDYAALVGATTEDIVRELADDDGSTFRLGIYLDGVLVGRVDLVGVEPPKYSLGYWLDAAHTGSGIATKAVGAAVDFAFAQDIATDIFAGVTHGNERSIALLLRLGFRNAKQFDTYARFHLGRP